MAKKRGRKKKAAAAAPKKQLPSSFWRQTVAVLIIVLAIIFVISWFHQGGRALDLLNNKMQAVLGYGYFVLPFLMVYTVVLMFRSGNYTVNPANLISGFVILILSSGLTGAASYGSGQSHGGLIGDKLNSLMVTNLSLPIAVFLYLIAIAIVAMFLFDTTPMDLYEKYRERFPAKEKSKKEKPLKVRKAQPESVELAGDEKELPKLKIRGVVAPEEIKSGKEKRGFLSSKKKGSGKPEEKASAAKADAKAPVALVSNNDPDWIMPSLNLLDSRTAPSDPGDVKYNASTIKSTFADFGIEVKVEGANVGPRITQYTFQPPQGVKISKIAQYDRDLATRLATDKVRIEAPIPGTRSVGVEIPNKTAASVGLHELLRSPNWRTVSNGKPLAFALGKDISGNVVVGNLAKMPHLLIAGTTGSGKSVMTNTLIMSMLYHNSPADLRFIIVDPKQVEMAAYNDIPHLLTPVITQVDKALSAMKWSVNEMERRYSLMAEKRVKTIIDYNNYIAKNQDKTEAEPELDEEGKPLPPKDGKMPYIVIIVDEMADLMMTAGKELEALIVRIAQKGRAAGMHLVLATQRPEVKVVTGLIKANVPGRIAFAVNNSMDSRVMLDMTGAEKLLGRGDMLYLTTEMMGKPRRVQGAFVSDSEIEKVTDYLRKQRLVEYNDEVISQAVQIGGAAGAAMGLSGGGADDELNWKAAQVAVENGKLSTSLLGRRLNIGYGKAARAMDNLEQMNVISPAAGGNRPREVLISSMDDYPGPRFD